MREVRHYTGPIPPTLGYLPPAKPGHRPALVAVFGIPDEPDPGRILAPHHVGAVHLTLLSPDGGKADCDPNKIVVGSPRGLPMVVAPPDDLLGLAITEGIEDALTVHLGTGLGAWAAGSAGLMPALAEAVPDYIDCVTIYAHHDDAGHRGALALAKALDARNIEIRIEGIALCRKSM